MSDDDDTKRVTPPPAPPANVANPQLVVYVEALLEDVRSGKIRSLCSVSDDGSDMQPGGVFVGDIFRMIGGLEVLRAHLLTQVFQMQARAAQTSGRLWVPGRGDHG